jgi:hypothetical protein
MEWYRRTLAFVGDPFPATPPFEFAILRQGPVELMLRRGSPPARSKPRQYDWDVYLRREGERFPDWLAKAEASGIDELKRFAGRILDVDSHEVSTFLDPIFISLRLIFRNS